MSNKPYHLMTRAEQIADRIKKNRELDSRVFVSTTTKVSNKNSGEGTRKEVGSNGSSFLIGRIKGVF